MANDNSKRAQYDIRKNEYGDFDVVRNKGGLITVVETNIRTLERAMSAKEKWEEREADNYGGGPPEKHHMLADKWQQLEDTLRGAGADDNTVAAIRDVFFIGAATAISHVTSAIGIGGPVMLAAVVRSMRTEIARELKPGRKIPEKTP